MPVAARSAGSGKLSSADEIVSDWKKRITAAREARKPLEKIWLSNLAFAAGQHWLVWDTNSQQMRHIGEKDPRYTNRDLYTGDAINEFIRAQLGELSTGDDRPELLTAQDGESAEEVAKHLNSTVAYAWEHEWNADRALLRARSYCLNLGTAAIRCRRDPRKGKLVQRTPVGADGRPTLDENSLAALEQKGTLPDGSLPKFRPVQEGKTIWEPFNAFQFLTPPGVTHEDEFPWEIIARPVLLDSVRGEYGSAADSLVEDGDIASAMGLSTGQQIFSTGGNQGQDSGRLREHVWLYTCYERPCRNYPDGRVVVLASNQYVLLDQQEQLPYQDANGERKSGIVYLHWWRLDDRFNSRAMVEPMKDPQRLANEVMTGSIEIMRRGYPKVFTKEGDLPHNPAGLPLENIEMKKDADAPHFFAGIGPGDWMFKLLETAAENLAHASTVSPLRLGENPQNVDTYSQLALLNENEAVKRSTIQIEHKAAIASLVEYGVGDIKQFWPDEKQITVAGEDGAIAEETFRKSQVPESFQVKTARGVTQPRSQAAELKKLDAIWAAAVQAGVATQPGWVEWYARSLDAGEAQEIPQVEVDSTVRLAHFENFLMSQGEDVQPADYDPPGVHLPIHREAQDQARAAGDMATYQRIQNHIHATVAVQAANAQKVAEAQQTPSPLAPAAPAGGQPVGGPAVFAGPDFLHLAQGNP